MKCIIKTNTAFLKDIGVTQISCGNYSSDNNVKDFSFAGFITKLEVKSNIILAMLKFAYLSPMLFLSNSNFIKLFI